MKCFKIGGKFTVNDKTIFGIFFCTAILVLCFCHNSKVTDVPEEFSYTPLHIGDIRQVVNIADSSTILYSIVGSTFRTDGQEVFIEIVKTGIGSSESSFDTFYCFLRDGFRINTQIDTQYISTGVYNVPYTSNPFQEQCITLEKPSDGFKWYPIKGYYSLLRSTRFAGNYQTFAGQFENVFAYDNWWYIDPSMEIVVCTYFARNVGQIGTEWVNEKIDPQKVIIKLAYAKIGSDSYGSLFPERDPVIPNTAKKIIRNRMLLYHLFGRNLPYRY
jgi:hypothetical protein